MTPQQLKASLLQEAIQGKLTDQRPEDGSAEELYRAIIAEKKRLIKAGKIKKEKPLPPIEEKDIPFDIPENWKWVRLGEITINRDAERIPLSSIDRQKLEKIYDYYGASGVIDKVDNFLFDKPLLLIAEDGANLVNRSTPVAFIAEGQYWVNNHAHVVDVCCGFSMKYLAYFVNAISLAPYISGTAQPKMNQAKMNSIPVSLPPPAEQERIVAKLEELLPLVERYGKAYTQLTALERRFPASMRKSLLQEAIQGKLTDQRPEDGSAEDLYRAILAEKKRLIKVGKLKKEKPLPPIEEKDIPFDIPENWKWVRLGEIGSFERGSGIKKTETVQEGLPCVRYGQLYTTFRTRFTEAVSFIPRPLFDVCKKAKCGDILMALTGENNFDIALAVAYEGKDSLAIGGDMTRYTPCSIVPMYLVTVLNSGHGISCKSKLATGDIIVHISNDKLASIPIPLPPLAEQERIVAKLEELLPLCD
ncbi:MAG: restriction endonuclease subunit S [Akkermansia sp.]|nr:restriction endonuclease subunit S [Akkermansia sp.]